MSLRLEDKHHYDVYKSLTFPLQELSFAFQFITPFYSNFSIETFHENTAVMLTCNGKRHGWGPLLPGNELQRAVDELFKMNIESIKYIPDEVADKYRELQGYALVHQNQDYLYLREKIATLSGDALKKKRNLRNYFVKNYTYRTEEYSREKHEKECVEFLERWQLEKKRKSPESAETIALEAQCNLKALQHAHDIGFHGMVVYVNDKLEGFTFGEVVNDILSVQIEKANLSIKGLPQFIYSEFVKKFPVTYVNAGEDWDVSYLKSVKESYHPFKVHKFYELKKV